MRFFRNNGLSLVLLGLFLGGWFGQSIAGWKEFNDERSEHRLEGLTYSQYLRSSHFVEATAENWESEFLQMGFYVVLTIFLFQKGSSESKDPDKKEPQDEDPRTRKNKRNAPWPVKRGGWVLKIYEHSLTIAFLLLFFLSAAGHALGGLRHYNWEQALHGKEAISLGAYLQSSRFWFESLQNWQSEFLAILSMVVLSIFLRERGSPESKPVASAMWDTGDEE